MKRNLSVVVMNFLIPSLSISFALFLVILIVTKMIKLSKSKNLKVPPGPWQLPLVGNIHQFVGSPPRSALRDLTNKYGPLMSLRLGQIFTVVVSSPEVASEIMKTHDVVFAKRPYLLAADILAYKSSDIVFTSYGDYWRQIRKICTLELFSSKCVHKFRYIREEEVLILVKSVAQNEGSRINLSREVYLMTVGIITRAAFGKKSKDAEAFGTLLKEVFELTAGFSVADMYPSSKLIQWISGIRRRLERLHTKLDKILAKILNEHKEGKENAQKQEMNHEDLVDVLLRVQRHGELGSPLTDSNIKAVLFDILSAGSETSSTTTTWAMSEMMRNPQVLERAQAEVRKVFDARKTVDETGLHQLNYLKMVVKETLRLHPPAPLLVSRECREQCKIKGYDIPMKTRVTVNAWAIGRDPRFWPEAESFKPERFQDISTDFRGADFQYIPFGAGRRICPGMSFAIPNIELPLAELLYYFDWKLPDGLKSQELDMSEDLGSVVSKKEDLHVVHVTYTTTFPMDSI